MFLVLVPVLAFVCVLLYLGNRWSFESTRLLLLRSSVTFGAYLVLLMEALSPFKAVTRLGLGLGWLLPVVGLSMWAWRRQRLGSPLRLPVVESPKRWGGWGVANEDLGLFKIPHEPRGALGAERLRLALCHRDQSPDQHEPRCRDDHSQLLCTLCHLHPSHIYPILLH